MLFTHRGACDNLSVEIRDETLSPEFSFPLDASAIDRRDVTAISHSMTALNSLPCCVLSSAEFSFFLREPTDGGRIKNDLGPSEGSESSGLGIPLIPANKDGDFTKLRVPDLVAEVAWSEIKFFFKPWVLRNVHLPVFT